MNAYGAWDQGKTKSGFQWQIVEWQWQQTLFDSRFIMKRNHWDKVIIMGKGCQGQIGKIGKQWEMSWEKCLEKSMEIEF